MIKAVYIENLICIGIRCLNKITHYLARYRKVECKLFHYFLLPAGAFTFKIFDRKAIVFSALFKAHYIGLPACKEHTTRLFFAVWNSARNQAFNSFFSPGSQRRSWLLKA